MKGFVWWLIFVEFGFCTETSSLCRLSSQNEAVPYDLFDSFACGECFYYTFLQSNKNYVHFYHMERCPDGVLICDIERSEEHEIGCNCRSTKHIYNLQEFNKNSTPLENLHMDPPLPFGYITMTRDCCHAARKCCEDMIMDAKIENYNKATHCPITWDGWQCWPRSESGSMVRGSCPYYTYTWTLSSDSPNPNDYFSMKQCTENGIWWINEASHVEWTDYRKCATSRLHDEVIKHIVGISSFAISVLAVIPALIIFCSYRSLKVDRISMHKHLLLSFLFTGCFYIFNNTFFVSDMAYGAPLVEANHISCRILFTIQLRYLRICNYTWMLCEGLYLYKLLIHAFAETRSLLVYYCLGWGFPIIPTIIYSALRAELDDDKCWIVPNVDWIEWITYGPCIISLVMNLILMLIILRLLITKLRHSPGLEPAQYRKAVRAILVLLPLFGLHFFLTIYRLKHILGYEIVNKLLDGLQGFLVSIVICYSNSEVLDLLKHTWRSRKVQKQFDTEMRTTQKLFQSAEQETLSTIY